MNKLSLLIPVIALSLTAIPVHASLQERVNTRQNKMEEQVENRQENREERQENRQEKRTIRFEDHGTRLEARFTAYYTRLNNIITKVQARIDASTDKDTTTAQSKLTEAKNTLAEAKSLADSAISQFKAIDPAKWEEQKEAAKAARDTANKARQSFLDTLKLINDSVKLLKSAPAK